MYFIVKHINNKAFIDIRLCPSIITPAIWPTMAKCDVILKTGSTLTYRNAARGGPSHGHRGSIHKFPEDRSSGSRDMLVDRHTHRQTN